MANMTLNSYLHQIYSAWDDCNGDRVAELLSLTDLHCASQKLMVDDNEEKTESILVSPLKDMVVHHLRVLRHLQDRNYTLALQSQCQFGQLFCKVLQAQKDENWGLLIMETYCQDLRKIAISAKLLEDPISRAEDNNTPTGMEKAADVIMALFRVCAADTRSQEQDTKRWGMLTLVNCLFKIYFKTNRLHLCKPLIRTIEQQTFKDRFPREQMVTYKYYMGRKSMFDSEFKTAEECLTFAFRNSSSMHNKKKILTYLIPVKMFLGWLPTKEALEIYDMMDFYQLSEALKDGNVHMFNDAMNKCESKFIREGIYVILEKLRMMLYRNLFKKVCLIYKNHQIPLKILEHALRWAGYETVDLDEIHCVVANLIFDNQIRGYISHQHQVLVVAKQNAFPKISALADQQQ